MPTRQTASYGRGALVAALVAAHAGVVCLATLGAPTEAVVRLPSITVNEIAEPTPVAPVIEPKLVRLTPPVEEPRIEIAGEAPPVAPLVLAATASGSGCAVSDTVQARLRASPEVQVALDQMPRASRSVADAVLLWNGRWIEADQVGGPAAIDPIRAVVADVVRAVPADCRSAQVTGPRFVFVPSATGARILTFGSGNWTWAQLLSG